MLNDESKREREKQIKKIIKIKKIQLISSIIINFFYILFHILNKNI